MIEYLGCRIERNWEEAWVRLTQPMILQSFKDEFKISDTGRVSATPTLAGSVLDPDAKEADMIVNKEHTKYTIDVGKLLHKVRWTRPKIWNDVRELTRTMKGLVP